MTTGRINQVTTVGLSCGARRRSRRCREARGYLSLAATTAPSFLANPPKKECNVLPRRQLEADAGHVGEWTATPRPRTHTRPRERTARGWVLRLWGKGATSSTTRGTHALSLPTHEVPAKGSGLDRTEPGVAEGGGRGGRTLAPAGKALGCRELLCWTPPETSCSPTQTTATKRLCRSRPALQLPLLTVVICRPDESAL